MCAACLPNTCQKQHYNASVTFILTDNEWHHDDDSGLRYADVVPEPGVTRIVRIRHQGLHSSSSRLQCSAVLHAPPGCSQVVGLGPIPPGPVSAQASSSSYPTLLQLVKVALRAQAQPPPVTSTLRRFSPDSKGRGKSQKYKPEFSLVKMKLNFPH